MTWNILKHRYTFQTHNDILWVTYFQMKAQRIFERRKERKKGRKKDNVEVVHWSRKILQKHCAIYKMTDLRPCNWGKTFCFCLEGQKRKISVKILWIEWQWLINLNQARVQNSIKMIIKDALVNVFLWQKIQKKKQNNTIWCWLHY